MQARREFVGTSTENIERLRPVLNAANFVKCIDQNQSFTDNRKIRRRCDNKVLVLLSADLRGTNSFVTFDYGEEAMLAQRITVSQMLCDCAEQAARIQACLVLIVAAVKRTNTLQHLQASGDRTRDSGFSRAGDAA